MTHTEEHSNRRSFRFSIRKLVILVTLLCVYFGVWKITRRNAASRVGQIVYNQRDDPMSIVRVDVPLPFLVIQREVEHLHEHLGGGKTVMHYKTKQNYYLWLCGPMFKLPFESEVKPQRVR